MMDKMYIHGVITITVFTNTHFKENHNHYCKKNTENIHTELLQYTPEPL